MNCHQSGYADTLHEELAHSMSGRFGGDHRNIDILWRRDLLEVDVEAVGEHERFPRRHVRRDFLIVQITLEVVMYKDHDYVRLLGGTAGVQDAQARGFGFYPGFAARIESDDDVHAGIAQIQRMRVALAAIADDGDCAPLQEFEISVFFVIAFCHVYSVERSLTVAAQ